MPVRHWQAWSKLCTYVLAPCRISSEGPSFIHYPQERGVLDTDTLRLQLDLPLLQASGLVAADRRAYWNKTEPRLRASLLYKQQKFNLLREETEGYSKLALELTNNMGPPHDARTARPIELRSDIVARAEQTVLRVKALIGYFDLDPSRALDIILDAFQDNIATHHVFFRELLRASPWGDGARAAKLDDAYTGSYTPAGESSPSRGNVVAQILGFKFAWYSVSCWAIYLAKSHSNNEILRSRMTELARFRRRSFFC